MTVGDGEGSQAVPCTPSRRAVPARAGRGGAPATSPGRRSPAGRGRAAGGPHLSGLIALLLLLTLAGCRPGGAEPAAQASPSAAHSTATASSLPAFEGGGGSPTPRTLPETATPLPTPSPKPAATATPLPTRTLPPTPAPTARPGAAATPLPTATLTPTLLPHFGAEMAWPAEDGRRGLAKQAQIYWVRFGAFSWAKIEPARTEPPTYHWETVDEESLLKAAADGMQVIAIIRFTPGWAQQVPGSYCGPVRAEAMDAYAQFLSALVERYSAPPFSVHYWELGNEPDVAPSLVGPSSAYGCWGDTNDPYYGGGYYAEMLKKAYPAIKAADARSRVVLGGLLLDCDPAHPPEGKDCQPAKFLEGVLRSGGGAFFDIVSFHGYATYSMSMPISDLSHRSWAARGGVVLGKAGFLREVLSSYGWDKPLLHTEGALLCPSSFKTSCNPPGPAFYEAQADYVVWLYVRNWAEGLLGTVWYTLDGPGWQESALLDGGQQPKPAYRALHLLTQELSGAVFRRPVAELAGLKGYEFAVPTGRVWVIWSPDQAPHPVTLPGGTLRVLDKYGQEVSPAGGVILVSSPVYLELGP